jgi:hypothetical protein
MLARTAPKPESTLLSTAMQMICGAIVLGIAAMCAGDTHFSLQPLMRNRWTLTAAPNLLYNINDTEGYDWRNYGLVGIHQANGKSF